MGEVLGCGECNKVVCDLVQYYKTAVYTSLVQGTPILVLQHSSDVGSVVILSIRPPGGPSLDCFHFLYISGSVCMWGDTVEAYSNCGLTSVLYATDFRFLLWIRIFLFWKPRV